VSTFKTCEGDWQQLRLLGTREIDFHRGRRPRELAYWQAMADVSEEALAAIRSAYTDGVPYLLIGHGHSTSRPFHVTARSSIRRLLRSPDVTPYVDRRRCIQHNACFLVALRPTTASK
jgi:hypothetical protein